MFSKACEYGIKAMVHIAQREDQSAYIRLKDISTGIESPEAFTAKILQQLTRGGLLISSKGPAGGFALAQPAQQVSISSIIRVIDGEMILDHCVLGLPQCGTDKPCPIHHKVVEARDKLRNVFNETTLDELTNKVVDGDAFLSF